MENSEIILEDIDSFGSPLVNIQGVKIPVFGAIQGEKVLVAVENATGPKKKVNLTKVLSKSKDRVDPPCVYFGECTGCQWQHISYERQLKIKYEIITNALREIEGFKDKSANNLIDAIRESKNHTAARLLISLGIKHVGVEISELLLDKYNSISNLINISYEELIEIPQIGPQIALSIREYFENQENILVLEELFNLGLKDSYQQANIEFNEIITSKTFVITGKFLKYKRSEIQDIITKYGGINSGNINSKTDYLILGENPGSKLEKANELNIKILSESEFINIIT